MTVAELKTALSSLPSDADVLVAQGDDHRKFDLVSGVGRLLIQNETKGQGGKVIAAVLRYGSKFSV